MIVAPSLSLFSPLFAMRRSWVRIPSRPPDSETCTIFESGRSSKSISATSPLIKLSPPRFLYPSGDLLAAVAARPNWTRTTSLVETATMLRGPKFSSHAVFADHTSYVGRMAATFSGRIVAARRPRLSVAAGRRRTKTEVFNPQLNPQFEWSCRTCAVLGSPRGTCKFL